MRRLDQRLQGNASPIRVSIENSIPPALNSNSKSDEPIFPQVSPVSRRCNRPSQEGLEVSFEPVWLKNCPHDKFCTKSASMAC